MTVEQDNADIEALLQKPEHTHPSKEALDQTRDDNLKDPKFHKEHPVDPGWHTNKDGFESHPEFK